MSIPESFIDDLKSRVDIYDVVSSRVTLKKAGNEYTACCPFHDEKTPSFTVVPKKNMYYCHGCQAGGNVVDFVMSYDRVEFPMAIEALAGIAGVEVPQDRTLTPQQKEQVQVAKVIKSKLPEVLQSASGFFYKNLKDSAAHAYLDARGLNSETVKRFRLGASVSLLDKGFDHSMLIEAGLVKSRDDNTGVYDFFRNRVMFPVRNEKGETVGFGGRVLDDSKPKYLNSSDTKVFDKSKVLYGLHESLEVDRKPARFIVVEGYMDVVSLACAGINNAVAGMGTAFTSHQAKLAFRHVDELVVCFDGDKAGIKAARRSAAMMGLFVAKGKTCRFVSMPETGRYSHIDEKTGQPVPECHDPDSFIKERGLDAFNALVDGATGFSDYVMNCCADQLNLDSAEGRAAYCSRFSEFLSHVPECAFLTEFCKIAAKHSGNTLQSIKLSLGNKPTRAAYAPTLGGKAVSTDTDWESGLLIDDQGEIKPFVSNVKRILLNDEKWIGVLAFDEFSQRVMKLKPPPWAGACAGEWCDNDDTELQIWLQEVYKIPLRTHSESAKAAISVALKHQFHAVRDWLESLPEWDQENRLENLLHRGFGAVNTDYTDRVSAGWLVSAIARVMKPGCKVDTMVILEGKQGRGKSSAISLLFSAPWYIDSSEKPTSKDFVITMMGNWVIEIGEMHSFTKADRSVVKQMITKQADKIRLPYGRALTELPRQCVFTGTTNEDAYLSDPTGSRRFLPVWCEYIDFEWLEENREQIWAQALVYYKNGFEWWDLPADVVQAEQQARADEHVWTEPIMRYLNRTHVCEFEYTEFGTDEIMQISTAQLMRFALKMPTDRHTKLAQMQVADIMKMNGWTGTKNGIMHCGLRTRVWRRPAECGSGTT